MYHHVVVLGRALLLIAALADTTCAIAEPAAPAKSESDRATRLKALVYDRSPSAIFRAWSAPEPPATKANAKSKPTPAHLLDHELATLQRSVTLGRWQEVKKYWTGLPKEEAQAGYRQMLVSLGAAPAAGGEATVAIPGIGSASESNMFSLHDVLGLIAACPHKIERPTLAQLAPIVSRAVQSGTSATELSARLAQEAVGPAGAFALTHHQSARLLLSAGQGTAIGPLLPSAEEATAKRDYEALNLLAQMQVAEHAKVGKPELLERAWQNLQATLAAAPPTKQNPVPDRIAPAGNEDAEEQATAELTPYEEALQLAVELAPRIRDQMGQTWLEASFASAPERGMAILGTLGPLASQAIKRLPRSPDERLKILKLQKIAVEALLKASPERATQWRPTLNLLAQSWQREADFTHSAPASQTLYPGWQEDRLGTVRYVSAEEVKMFEERQESQPRPIEAADLWDVGPSDAWLHAVDASLLSRFQIAYIQLYLQANEPERAFPYLKLLAAAEPARARDLAHELIRSWTSNHDPNASRRGMNPYMVLYGANPKAAGIPLSRANQQRSLAELATWTSRLRALPIEELDESLLATAFTTCHSSAEVYQRDAVEKVFGPIEALKPKTLSQLLQAMRTGLAETWRQPAEQEAKKTRRTQKDIEVEVLRGYSVARGLVRTAQQAHPEDWHLQLAKACLMHDENAFRQEVKPSSQYSQQRRAALTEFRQAAERYAKALPTLRETEQSNEVYERWFYAGLGASDLGMIDHKSTPDALQPALVRAAIEGLPREAARRHREQFAKNLFTHAKEVKPNVKFRYLSGGLEIVGDEQLAREARKQYEYYHDLVTEIQLVARLDGSSNVGIDEPFGVFVELRHTIEIERESGGFGKYLTNQNSMLWGYNYGRPAQDYRDLFKESVNSLLTEQFEVLSITFHDEKVHARADAQPGWRVTPYAYLLLKPRGPQVDKLPALKMDLDFLDDSGYVILPVQSAPIPLDAKSPRPAPRPFANLQLSQTLDERQAADGKLVLEIKATARGLVPTLQELADVRPEGFTVVKIDDQGVGVSQFDPESDEIAITSERVWLVSLAGRSDLAARPTSFAFPAAKTEGAKIDYFHYQDADLVKATSPLMLQRSYGSVRWPWAWILGIPLAAALLALAVRAGRRRRTGAVTTAPVLPATLTPFGVLSMLRHLHAHNGLAPHEQGELEQSIAHIERFYFAGLPGNEPDLRGEAETWLARVR